MRDSSISWQFVVDQLPDSVGLVAPDWRGHGLTQHFHGGYWLHEFLGDLDSIVQHVSPDCPVTLIGHSLGGNLATLYAGLREDKVSHVVSLDGFGPLPGAENVSVAALLDKYLERLRTERRANVYASFDALIARLMRSNPRLPRMRAEILALGASRQNHDGTWSWLHDPDLGKTLQSLHSLEEWRAVWANISAPVHWLASEDPRWKNASGSLEELRKRGDCIRSLFLRRIKGVGHNMHHEDPVTVASMLREILQLA